MLKRTFVCALLAMGLMLGTAQAGPITGTFTIDIYQGDGGGLITNPEVQANLANPLLVSGYMDTVTYTGAIDFFLPSGGTNTVDAFLASGLGTVVGLDAGVGDNLLSAGGFGWTTVLVISGFTAGPISGTIVHDDGISLYQGAVQVVDSAYPTVPIPTDYSLNAGNFQLVYVAANNLPEQLQMNVVPDGGSTLTLLGFALVGFGALRRKFGA